MYVYIQCNDLVIINCCLTFNDDGVIRFIDATADRADGEKEKMNGRGKENCKMGKSGHSRRHVTLAATRLNFITLDALFLFHDCER
jgi:hypothetical protein